MYKGNMESGGLGLVYWGPVGVGTGDVMYAGLVLQQGYFPGEHPTHWTQNSHFKLHFLGVSGLTASSYILHYYTPVGHKGIIEYIFNVYIYIHFNSVYLFVCDALKCNRLTSYIYGTVHSNRTVVALLHKHFFRPSPFFNSSSIITHCQYANMRKHNIMPYVITSFSLFWFSLFCQISLQYQ